MTRFLVLLAILLLVWTFLRRAFLAFARTPEGRQLAALFRFLRTSSAATSATPEPGPGRPRTATPLERCSVCSTYVPAGRALHAGGKVYCSPECRERARAT